MNLDKKIKEILEEVWNDNMSPESEGDRETVIKAHKELKQLFIQELKACLPEKRTGMLHMIPNTNVVWNECIDKAEQNINKLLGEGVENE